MAKLSQEGALEELEPNRYERAHLLRSKQVATSWGITERDLSDRIGTDNFNSRRFVGALVKLSERYGLDECFDVISKASHSRLSSMVPHKGLNRCKPLTVADVNAVADTLPTVKRKRSQLSHGSASPLTATTSSPAKSSGVSQSLNGSSAPQTRAVRKQRTIPATESESPQNKLVCSHFSHHSP